MGEEAGKYGPPVLLPEDTVMEILLRLPLEPMIRSGAVCKAWRRIIADPHFLVAHAVRSKTKTSVLLHANLQDGGPWPPGCGDNGLGAEDAALRSLPISSAAAGWPEQYRLVRHPKTRSTMRHEHCRLLATCNGVLLFIMDKEQRYLLCNPVTRRWAELPRLADEYYNHNRDPERGFYFHQQSGEYRLLLGVDLDARVWFVASTGGSGAGAAQPRQLHLSAEQHAAGCSVPSLLYAATTPVALHGRLHWMPHKRPGLETTTEMVAFDVSSETFHRMAGPPTTTPGQTKLFEMGGLLVAADVNKKQPHVDLWFLEDYRAARWELRHRVVSPWNGGAVGRWDDLRSVAAAGDEEGNVILGDHFGLLAYDTRRREATWKINADAWKGREYVHVTRHVFKGSLELHPCFSPAADVPLIHSWF